MGIDIVYGRESSWFLGVVSSGVVEGVLRYIPYICLTSSDFFRTMAVKCGCPTLLSLDECNCKSLWIKVSAKLVKCQMYTHLFFSGYCVYLLLFLPKNGF